VEKKNYDSSEEEAIRHRGIPATADRAAFLRFRAAVIGAGILIGLALFSAWISYSRLFPAPDSAEIEQRLRRESRRVNVELTEAHEQRRQVILRRIAEMYPDAIDVEWRHVFHEGHLGWYRFEGSASVIRRQDEPVPVRYDAIIIFNPETGGWRSEKADVQPAENE
jgi:hypothetical protein